MPFQFIDNASIDRGARKKIRRHAAKGHNVGRVLTCRRKRSTLLAPARLQKSSDASLNVIRSGLSFPIGRSIGDNLSVCRLQADTTPASRNLILRVLSFVSTSMFPQEHFPAFPFGTVGSMWVELVSRDEACFHCNAALSVVAFDPYFDDKENAVVALRHWTFALRLLNERLSGKDACSDLTIANIVSMTHYDRLRGAYEQGLVHFDGLRKMVDVRGGISEFTKVWPRMAQKVFRSDLEFSLHLGSRTRYHLNDVRTSHNHSWVRTSFMKAKNDGLCHIYAAEASSVDLQDAFIEVMSLSWLLNNQEEYCGATDAYMLHEIIIHLIYLLLDIRPLGDTRSTNFVDEALYAGLLSFVVTFLIDLGRKVPEYALLYKLARISAKAPSYEYQDHKELCFWMLLIGRSSVFRDHDDGWLAPKVSETAHSLNIQSWEDAKRILSKFPWFSPFHNKQGQRLWEKSILLQHSSGTK